MDALVAECETIYCPDAPQRAEEVVKIGVSALPALDATWKWTTDPDVMIWTEACRQCIKNGWSLVQYQDALREVMHAKGGGSVRAATHLYLMRDLEALVFLWQSWRFNLWEQIDLSPVFVLRVLDKRPAEPLYIEMLSSPNLSWRKHARKILWSAFNTDNGYNPEAPVEERAKAQQGWREFWEQKRPEVEAKWRAKYPEYKKEFHRYRRLFE